MSALKTAKKIKVCGMREADNIRAVAALPIDYIGFIFYERSARHVKQVPEVAWPTNVKRVGVFVDETTATIRKVATQYRLDAIQLHGQESADQCQELREHGFEAFKAFGVDSEFDWTRLEPYLSCTDYFLFDTKSPQHGGTGRTFDWDILSAYPYERPYLLSGGLSPENISAALAIEDPRLVGLDLNSKFEIRPGLKNIETLTQAVKLIKNEQISSR